MATFLLLTPNSVIIRAQLFKRCNYQNDPDFEIPCFAFQDQLIRLTFIPVIQSTVRLDKSDPDNFSRLPDPDNECSKWDCVSHCGY